MFLWEKLRPGPCFAAWPSCFSKILREGGGRMQFVKGNNLPRVRAANRSSILRMVYHCAPITRADIARRLGLTLPTITTNISAMSAGGLVRELDRPENADQRSGRKSRLLDIVPQARKYVGVEMQGTDSAVCVTDFRGQVLGRAEAPAADRDYEHNLDMTCRMVRDLLAQLGLCFDDIDALGFCLPGLVDTEGGILRVRPSFNWFDKNILRDVRRRLGFDRPICVENNACARACGASLFQRELLNDVQTFAYLFIHTGIACPLILNTSGSYGSIVGAGEVGHMVMEPNGPQCTCGNHGCLEAISSNRAIISRCMEALAKGEAPILRSLCPKGEAPTMDQILQAQEAGDPAVYLIVERAVYTLGVAIANIDNFTCPHTMLIDGKLFGNPANRRQLLDVARRNICNVSRGDTDFIFVEPDRYSGARGAAAVAIAHGLQTCAE